MQCFTRAEHRSLSAGRHWRLSRVYGGIARRNCMDSTGDSSVVSPCPTVLPRIVSRKFFCGVIAFSMYILFG